MNQETTPVQRVIGLDSHPDSFTAAILRGPTPAAAVVEKIFHKLPMSRLVSWAQKHTTGQDLIVLEASGNSFHVVRSLAACDRQAKVLESAHLGKLKEVNANNDRISAVRIGKAYLAGTAKEVWVPDLQTQQRRDCFHAYAKSTKRTTQMRARIRSYLSDNGVRLPQTLCLTQTQEAQERIFKAKQWSACQQELIAMMLEDLRHAHDQRQRWRSLIAREVAADPLLLSLVRLCGVRDIIAFALGAFIGDINRFANPKKLVSYVGLHPAFDDSGQSQWSGGIGGHGHKLLRSLLIEGAQAILRSAHHPMAKWGKRLLASKGSANVAVAAMARKLTVAVWYLMMGRWTPLTDIDSRLMLKVGKIISAMGRDYLKRSGQKRHVLRKNIYERLKFGRTYVVKMHKPPGPAAPRPGLRIRSGLRMRSNLAED